MQGRRHHPLLEPEIAAQNTYTKQSIPVFLSDYGTCFSYRTHGTFLRDFVLSDCYVGTIVSFYLTTVMDPFLVCWSWVVMI